VKDRPTPSLFHSSCPSRPPCRRGRRMITSPPSALCASICVCLTPWASFAPSNTIPRLHARRALQRLVLTTRPSIAPTNLIIALLTQAHHKQIASSIGDGVNRQPSKHCLADEIKRVYRGHYWTRGHTSSIHPVEPARHSFPLAGFNRHQRQTPGRHPTNAFSFLLTSSYFTAQRQHVRRRAKRLYPALPPPLVRTHSHLQLFPQPLQLPFKTAARRLGAAQRRVPVVRQQRWLRQHHLPSLRQHLVRQRLDFLFARHLRHGKTTAQALRHRQYALLAHQNRQLLNHRQRAARSTSS
jgi:hypothetical protein